MAILPCIWLLSKWTTEIVKLLLKASAAAHTFDNSILYSAVMQAATGGFIDIVKILIEAGSDINHVDRYSRNALLHVSFVG